MQFLLKKWIGYIALLFPFLTQAQQEERVRAYGYSVNEGLLQTTITDAACDRFDRLWLSFPNGVQRFNGLYFETISVQDGLPDDKFIRFFKTGNENFFILHSKGISKYNEATNKMELVCKAPFDPVIHYVKVLGEWEQQIYLSDNERFYVFDTRSFRISSVKFPNFYNEVIPGRSSNNIYSNIKHGLVFIHNTSRWALMSLRDFSLLRSGAFPGHISAAWKPFLRTDTTVLLADPFSKYPLRIWSPIKESFIGQVLLTTPNRESFLANLGDCEEGLLLQVKDSLLLLNDKMHVEKKLVNYNSIPATEGLHFQKMITDRWENLYLISITDGITMIPGYRLPFRHFRNKDQPGKDNILSIAVDKTTGRVTTAGRLGIAVYDTNQQRLFSLTKNTTDNDFCITQVVNAPDGGYVFTTFAPFAIWQCDASLKNVRKLKVVPYTQTEGFRRRYFTKTLLNNAKEAILAQENMLIRIDWNTQTASCHIFPRIGYTMSAHLQDPLIWMHSEDSMYFINSRNNKISEVRYFPHTGNVRCYTSLKSGLSAMGTNKGLFILDKHGNVKYRIDKSKGLPDECVYSVQEDAEGNLWYGSNKGILKINHKGITQYTKEDGLQENEFNTNVSLVAPDGELYFGGISGVNSFYPSELMANKETPELRLLGVEVNNEPAFLEESLIALDEISLPYNKNSLSFAFIARGKSHLSQYVYQYRISELEEKWQSFLPGQSLRFLLPPGTYQLQVAASRNFQQSPRPLKTITIKITPPFWRTIWFLSLCFLGFIGVIFIIAKQYVKHRIWKQNVKLEAEKKLQAEKERISRDLHDNIGAYANALLYGAELIETDVTPLQREHYIRDIKFAAKDIVTSLRETVWALQQDAHTAEEIFIRLKSYMQSLRDYYPNIKFQLLGSAPAELRLQSQASLNIIRIGQEAITNAIKHSHATIITLKSETEDNGYWSMTIEDNGIGFDWENVKMGSTGNGLSNIHYRAQQSAIHLLIRSDSNGTKIKMSYPYKRENTSTLIS